MTGIVYESGAWLYKLLMALALAVVCVFLVTLVARSDLNTVSVQRDLLLQRVLYSPDSVWIVENGIVHTGVVDTRRWDQYQFDRLFAYPERYGGARLSVRIAGSDVIQPVYVNKDWYTAYASQRVGASVETHAYPVVINTNGVLQNAILIVDVAMPERA